MQRFNTLLKQPELSTLNTRILETQAAQKIWEAIATDNLTQFSHANSIKNQQLTVFAYNNVVAAKIKLLIPSLLIKLQKQECEVTAIRIKVQVKSTPLAKHKPSKKLSPVAIKQLRQLEEKLSGTALGDALNKLIKTAD